LARSTGVAHPEIAMLVLIAINTVDHPGFMTFL
jgi:hypothetical protein